MRENFVFIRMIVSTFKFQKILDLDHIEFKINYVEVSETKQGAPSV